MKWIKIVAMSYELKKLKDELLHNNPRNFASHCAKLMICNENDVNIEYWQKELFACCDTKETYSVALNIAWEELHLDGKRDTSKDQNLFNSYRTFCDKISCNLAKHTLTMNIVKRLSSKYIVNLYRNLSK